MMQNMQGLAAQPMQETLTPNNSEMEQLIQEILKLLQQGVSPDELIKQGIPPELVQEAIKMMQQSEEQKPTTSGQGLAALQL